MSYQQFFKKAQSIKRGDVDVKPSIRSIPIKRGPAKVVAGERRNSTQPSVSWPGLVGLLLSLVVTGLYLWEPESFETLFDKIEISAIGGAAAEEHKAAEKSSHAAPNAEKPAAAEVNKEAAKSPGEGHAVSEDLSHFEKLKQRKQELDAREKELSELEEELQRQKVELDKRIQQLEQMRTQIAQILKERVEADQEKVNKLVELYSTMKPKQAADIIGSIDEDLAVEILAKMKKKNAAEIMNLLPAEKARMLSEKYTGYRRNHPEQKG